MSRVDRFIGFVTPGDVRTELDPSWFDLLGVVSSRSANAGFDGITEDPVPGFESPPSAANGDFGVLYWANPLVVSDGRVSGHGDIDLRAVGCPNAGEGFVRPDPDDRLVDGPNRGQDSVCCPDAGEGLIDCPNAGKRLIGFPDAGKGGKRGEGLVGTASVLEGAET